MEWFDPTLNVQFLHPSAVRKGMSLARAVTGEDGQVRTALYPVWDIGTAAQTFPAYSIGYWFRTSDGKLHSASSADRVPVITEITDETQPPSSGIWITNQRFDENAGLLGDRHFYERSRAIDKFEAEDGRVYRLLYGCSRRSEDTGPGERWSCFWVCRWDRGVKWLGPSRGAQSLTEEQFEKIREGKAW
jgi:hypothetical protein